MAKNTLNTSWTSDGLLIAKQSVGGDLDGSLQWVASRLDGKRILLSEVSSPIDPSTALGFAKCTSEMLYDLILGIHRRGWTGMVNVDLGVGYKRLFFTAGELVFAGSDLMDDRLGEVIYRHEMITLDQLTDFAVQVDRKTKFGQVLLRSGKFTNTDLWNALKSQVAEIFRSIFFVDHCVIEVREGTAPIEVSFESGTEALLDAAYSFGVQFRGFCRRVRGGARVFPVQLDDGASIATGTFAGDLLQICSELQNIQDILNRSKLADLNTLFAIHKLISCGRLRVEGLSDPVVSHLDGRFTALKSCIDSYQFLHGIVIKSFESAGLALPIRELSDFALSLNQRDDVSIYLDSSGVLSEESIGNILRQCSANLQRLAYFRIRIESLTRYLLQMAGDLLPNEISADLKRSFREISQ